MMTKEQEGIIRKMLQHPFPSLGAVAGKTSKGKFVFTDGYMMFEAEEDLGYKRVNGDKYAAFMNNLEDSFVKDPESLRCIKCPDLKDVREQMKKSKIYDMGDGLPAFDARRLRDVLRFVGSGAVMYHYFNIFLGVLVTGSKGRAYLMPVRKNRILEGMEKYDD